MSNGLGNIAFSEPPGAGGGGGGTVTAAANGVSLNGTTVVLGNDVGDATTPAKLLNDRVIPMNDFSVSFIQTDLDTNFFDIDSGATAMLNYFKGASGQQPLELITIQGQAPGVNPYGNFWWTLDETFTNPDGQIDAVWQWGYNQDGVGGIRLAGEAAFWFSLESHFQAGGSEQFEHEWQVLSKDGTNTRILQLDVNKIDANCIGMWTGGTWSWSNDASSGGAEFFAITGPVGGVVASGSLPFFQLSNPANPGFGQFLIETTNDGSVLISNSTTASDNQIFFSNPLTINNSNVAFGALNINLANADTVEGVSVQGTVSAGSGTAFPFVAEVSATGEILNFMENIGTGDTYFIARVAVGTGNSQIQFSNADNSKVFTHGLLQSSSNFVMTNGTGVGSGSNMLTMTPTAQAGFGGNAAPTAFVHIAASGGTPGLGPLKLTAAALLAVPEDGLIEYDGTNFYKTIGAVRSIIV
jgi:hypothetical protein